MVLKRTAGSCAPTQTPVTRSGVMPMNHPSEWPCVVPVFPAMGTLMLSYSRRSMSMRRRMPVPLRSPVLGL